MGWGWYKALLLLDNPRLLDYLYNIIDFIV